MSEDSHIPSFPRRMIHLDFHTGPSIPDVASDFEPREFARIFKASHVDSVTIFAMCHHGHLYYDTKHPAMHPALPANMNLLGQQIEALHAEGIRAPIYLSVQVNEFAANTHPEWIALTPDLKHVKGGGAFDAAWQILDMSSPYQDYLADILREVLDCFAPSDGIFFDMCWDQQSCSKWAVAGMEKRGYDPRNDDDRKRYAREVAHGYMTRFRDMIKDAHGGRDVNVWFNSRPKTNLYDEKKFLHHVEIESLPTGGWGYDYFPYVSRFVRPLKLPTLAMTGRFFKSWGDNSSLKPKMALKYECCQVLSQGMSVSVGDLLHPRGMPQKAVYDLIGDIYGYIKRCEPYVEGGTLCSQIAVVVDPKLGDRPGPAGIGATKALQQLQQQFDIVASSAELNGYELVIIPETTSVDASLKSRLRRHLAGGGALIVCGSAAIDKNENPILEELGIRFCGHSPYSHTFIHAEDRISKGLSDYGYVMYEPSFRMKASSSESETLAWIGEPYFERSYNHFSGHSYTPENAISEYAAAIKTGRTITFAVPLFLAYGKHASPNYRTLLGNCIELLLPTPLIKINGPSALETTVVKKDKNLIVHLLSFCPERRGEGMDIIEDPFPLVGASVSVKSDTKPKRVFMAPNELELDFSFKDGYVRVNNLTMTEGHGMIVVER